MGKIKVYANPRQCFRNEKEGVFTPSSKEGVTKAQWSKGIKQREMSLTTSQTQNFCRAIKTINIQDQEKSNKKYHPEYIKNSWK